MIKAEVILSSMSPNDIVCGTLTCIYPRYIHAEVMTHRVFNRNAGSSRAIPVWKLIKAIRETPAIPVHWGLNQKGMQANKEVTGWRRWLLQQVWNSHRRSSLRHAWLADKLGGHKQLVNRMIENHGHIKVIITATEWSNFFKLRTSKKAMPEIQELAWACYEALGKTKPVLLDHGEWHLPFVTEEEKKGYTIERCLEMSAARCARVSYQTFDGRPASPIHDTELAMNLLKDGHMSPFEHQATPDRRIGKKPKKWEHPEMHGSLKGWIQNRKQLPHENYDWPWSAAYGIDPNPFADSEGMPYGAPVTLPGIVARKIPTGIIK